MLHFIRKINESFYFRTPNGNAVKCIITKTWWNKVEISFEHFSDVEIFRTEVYEKKYGKQTRKLATQEDGCKGSNA